MIQGMKLCMKIAAASLGAFVALGAGVAIMRGTVMAATVEEQGDCGDDATYVLDSDGVLTISGTGNVYSQMFMSKDSIKKVVIEDGIEAIGSMCFYNCPEIEEVIIPSSCWYIYSEAFYKCEKLESLTLSEGVFEIHESAFKDCTSLTSLELPESIDSLGKEAFMGCTSLRTLVVPGSINVLGNRQFVNCTGLEEVWLSGETGVQSSAFAGISHISLLHYDGSASQTGNWIYIFDEIEYNKFDVTYYYMDGRGGYSSAIVDKGELADSTVTPPDPVQDHVFTGEWYTDISYDEESKFDFSTPIIRDYELYAKWDEVELAALEGYKLKLTGDIGVVFYVSVPDSLLAYDDARVIITNSVPEGKIPSTQAYPVAAAATEKVGSKTYRKFEFNVAAATMTCPITIRFIYDGNEIVLGENFTIREYGEYILEHSSQPEYAAAAPMVNAMLNYGAYSQLYFGVRTEDLANKNIEDRVPQVDVGEYEGIPSSFVPDDPPITYYGSSLSLESKVSAIVYFKLAKGVDYHNYQFRINSGAPITPDQNEAAGYISIKINDINPASLIYSSSSDWFVIRISGGVDYNYAYSPLYFIQAACASDSVSDNMKNLAKALYLYGTEAKAYLG